MKSNSVTFHINCCKSRSCTTVFKYHLVVELKKKKKFYIVTAEVKVPISNHNYFFLFYHLLAIPKRIED